MAPGDDIRPFRKMKDEVVGRFEKEYLSQVLRMYEGNLSKASRHAGMNIKNFHEKMARYGLKKEDFKTQRAEGREKDKSMGMTSCS